MKKAWFSNKKGISVVEAVIATAIFSLIVASVMTSIFSANRIILLSGEKSRATFLAEELPVVIQTLFASSPRREDNFIMGYAMGGNVALAAALARPDRYTACVDLSGGIGMTLDVETLMSELYSEHFSKYFPLYGATFGKAEEVAGSRFDLHAVALKNRASGQPECHFTLVCGSKEFIRLRMENDARILKELDFDVDYIVAEGYDHDFKMWNDYIEIALDKLLPLKRAAIYPDEA